MSQENRQKQDVHKPGISLDRARSIDKMSLRQIANKARRIKSQRGESSHRKAILSQGA
jgi:hypothetical protein